jgi:WD40 repeat protein
VAAVGRQGLATGGADGHVRLTLAGLGGPTAVLAGHEGWVWAVAALGQAHLASASEDGCVRVWDLEGGRCVACLEGGTPLRALAPAPGGQMLAVGGLDGRVMLWQRAGAQWLPQRGWPAHGAAVRRLRFFSAGLLASTGEDGWVRLWRLADTRQVAAMRHDNFATDVLPLGPDGWLSCSYDGSLRAGPQADAATACQERGPAPAGDRGAR